MGNKIRSKAKKREPNTRYSTKNPSHTSVTEEQKPVQPAPTTTSAPVATTTTTTSSSPTMTVVKTTPIEGQKPGTSGLRKKTVLFESKNFVENFVQSTFDAIGAATIKGQTLVVGGDGRYFNKSMCQTIIKMAAANGFARVWVGKDGLLSTPAVSNIIRVRGGGAAIGGFILTASHNPGGKTEDCGIKYNVSNGGPAPEGVTNDIYKNTTTISEYKIASDMPDVALGALGETKFGDFTVEVIDEAEDYLAMVKTLFDFPAIKALLARDDFKFVYDSMHGIAGPYATKIFTEELDVPAENVINSVPLEDFGGGHPDPNLTYAKELVKIMGLTKTGAKLDGVDAASVPDFGAAADGDADRNMVLGKQFFVTPSDSVAIIAANADCLPYVKKAGGLKGLARSMPTSAALDLVAQKAKIPFFEVPTGWKFFGNLMDSGVLGKEDLCPLICGEESFGTGSSHIREKDGIWAVLCWLQILAAKNTEGSPLVSVEDIVRDHWKTYGRNYYVRYDYEGVGKPEAEKMMARLTGMCDMFAMTKTQVSLAPGYTLADCNEFEYVDPVDDSVSSHQGWRFIMTDGSRFVFRLSGTGSVGATIRLYLEKYEKEESELGKTTQEALGPMVDVALSFSQIKEYTGREEPSVIT